jgi:hypothetical protein
LSALGLAGGFAVARRTGNRPLGGLVWAGAGLACAPSWRRAGTVPAVTLAVAYVGALAGSHPLAKKVGAWPSVALVSAGMAALAWAVADRRDRP